MSRLYLALTVLILTATAAVPIAAVSEEPRSQDDVQKLLSSFNDAKSDKTPKAVTNQPTELAAAESQEKKDYRPMFVGDDPATQIVPPEENAQVRLNKEAPAPFLAMAMANQQGDKALARKYAGQYVRYMLDLMFQVRELTTLIGEALVEQGLVDEEDWVGTTQFMNRELAYAKQESGEKIKATHENTLERITADPQGQVDIFFFCSLSSKHCRDMTPDFERLYRTFKGDKSVQMAYLTLGDAPKEYLQSFKQYTGLTAPLYPGEKLSKKFRVAFVPALIVIARNSQTVYLRTGKQQFKHMYEVVRKVQGQPLLPTKEFYAAKDAVIGDVEKAKKKGLKDLWEQPKTKVVAAGEETSQSLGRF